MSSLLWILIFIGVMYWMHGKGGGCCGGSHDHEHNHDHDPHNSDQDKKEKSVNSSNSNLEQLKGQLLHSDPVCGKNIPEDLAIKKSINGITYYFCSQECLKIFTEISVKK